MRDQVRRISVRQLHFDSGFTLDNASPSQAAAICLSRFLAFYSAFVICLARLVDHCAAIASAADVSFPRAVLLFYTDSPSTLPPSLLSTPSTAHIRHKHSLSSFLIRKNAKTDAQKSPLSNAVLTYPISAHLCVYSPPRGGEEIPPTRLYRTRVSSTIRIRVAKSCTIPIRRGKIAPAVYPRAIRTISQ